MSFDFIIIGSGLAGLTSALVAKDYGSVLIITKGKLSDCATNLAQGGIAAVTEDSDSFINHINDTLIAGAYHNNKKAVEYVVKHAPQAIDWLENQGVNFEKNNFHFLPTREAAHSHRRILHATDFTGREIEKALIRRVKQEKNIEIWENCFVTDLLEEDNVCYGVRLIIDEYTGPAARVSQTSLQNRSTSWGSRPVKLRLGVPHSHHPIIINSNTVILATGGLGQIYQWTTNPEVATGDGVALAYKAGAKIKDIEFIQFHPTALKDGGSPLFLLSEALRGEGANLKKSKIQISNDKSNPKSKVQMEGERFMDKYDERGELAPRDVVARAIFAEQKKGYEIYLDIRHKGKEFLEKRFPNISLELKRRGFDLSCNLIPVTPAAHYSCGGVEVDLYGRTNIKKLFAFGEVSCSGIHGANRLASNSLLEAVVFPLRLKKYLKNIFGYPEGTKQLKDSLKYLESEANNSQIRGMMKIRKKLQMLMWEKVGIVRTKENLKEAEEILGVWEEKLGKINSINKEYLELKNMIQAAKLIVKACVKRPESIGAHFMV